MNTPRTDELENAHLTDSCEGPSENIEEVYNLARELEREISDLRNHEYAGELKATRDENERLKRELDEAQTALNHITIFLSAIIDKQGPVTIDMRTLAITDVDQNPVEMITSQKNMAVTFRRSKSHS